MSNFGIKISKPGYDVKFATPLQLVFSSELNTLKIAETGTFSATGSDPYGAFAVMNKNHNLGVAPGYLAWVTASGYSEWKPVNEIKTLGNWGADVYTDNTKIEVQFFSDTNRTITVFYILFVDPGN